MGKFRRPTSLNWLRLLITGNSGAKHGEPRPAIFFRLLLTAAAGLTVTLGWFFIERDESYRVGHPSPRTYLAISPVRFTDRTATSELRHQAANQIVGVRVRNERATQLVMQRLDDLKNGNVDFAPSALVALMKGMEEGERIRVLSTALEIAERNYDKSASRNEQTAVIWDSLRLVDMSQPAKNIVFQILDALMVPTVQEDLDMTGRLRDDVSNQIPAVVREVRLGGLLVEKGQVVTEALGDVLREQGYPDAAMPWKNLAFTMIVALLWSQWLTWLGSKQEVRLSNREWMFIAVILIIDWAAMRWMAKWDIDSLSLLATVGWLFLTITPAFAFQAALGGCLIGYLLAFPNMPAIIAVGCIICGVAAGASFILVRDASSRIMIWRNIFNLGLSLTFASLFIRWGIGLSVTWDQLGIYLVLCAFWSSLVVAVLPLWETLFEMLSPLRLLEMSHPSQPLLKRLQLEAPGTYHHTVSVATLAEAVADKIGMNGLLVKTGAFYHDIGKLKRPHYFVENQSFGDNIHDRLAPQESAKIILWHVGDGLKLADDYKLPEGIKNFIREHHGKTCLTYFYQKALNADKEAGGDGSSVEKSDYCYSGPNPKHAETALVMLADSIEAALKGQGKAIESRAALEKLVTDVVDSKLISGQFVDVDFTLKDINAIKQAFVEVLMSMYHTREVKPVPAEGEPAKKAQEPGAPKEGVALTPADLLSSPNRTWP